MEVLFILALASLLPFLLAASARADKCSRTAEWGGGFPVGNFGICAQVTPDGRFLPRILVNPSRLGPWLQEMPGGSLTIESVGTTLRTEEFGEIRASRAFPFASLELSDPRMPGTSCVIRVFSPMAANDCFATSLPVLLAEISIANETPHDQKVHLSFRFDEPSDPRIQARFAFADGADARPDAGEARAMLVIAAGASRSVRLVICYHDADGFYAERLQDCAALVRYALTEWDNLLRSTLRFSEMLPVTGDSKLDEYLRWYFPAAVYLTRITRDAVLTMGYCELNQRDSFWTTWAHLVYWPDLEARMLRETADHVRPDGKVPTTILPIIEREDDLDINAYFLLRLERYWRHWRDDRLVREIWPDAARALEWLICRDTDGDGLVEQQSYWADWKDVPGVEGRLHAPHFEFAWLAALLAGQTLATVVGDSEAAIRYGDMAASAAARLHSDLADGGLWNGEFYTSRWKDGRKDRHGQQDQLIGSVFGLIEPDRLRSIYRALEGAMAPWGIRETYPYRQPFNNEPGDYHNGGVWPFLSFMDALGRFVNGYPAAARDLMVRVGHWDLEEFGDYTPHEYLCGETGENRGPVIQGLNADYFAAVLWGALGFRIIDSQTVEIAPRLSPCAEMHTAVPVPQGVIWLDSRGDTTKLTSECGLHIVVRFGRWSSGELHGAERLGEGWISWREISLPPGGTQTV